MLNLNIFKRFLKKIFSYLDRILNVDLTRNINFRFHILQIFNLQIRALFNLRDFKVNQFQFRLNLFDSI